MSEKVRKTIAVQGSILAMAGIISKIIGFLYRIPMANVMGNTGNGLYSVSFGIYNVALTLSSYSMPLAVSKLMSARIAKKQYKDADRLFKRALLFAFITGLIAALCLYFGADFLAGLYKKDGLERPLRILAPTTFVVALLGTSRGYFQGHRNMVPTAASQVIEQIVNAIVSVVASAAFVNACTDEALAPSYGAMGGTLGTLMGAISALLIFAGLFFVGRKQRKAELSGEDTVTEDNSLIFKAIIFTVIPVIISQTIYQFGYTLDDFLFGNILSGKGLDEKIVTDWQGVFNTQYNQMINLPTAIATAMASATLPSIVSSFTVKEYGRVKEKIDSVLKINMLIAIPSMFGLAAMADPMMAVLFPGLKEYHGLAVTLLVTGSSAVVFYTLSTLTTSVLQGCDRMNVPVIHCGISLLLHGLIVGILLKFTDLNVYALIIGNVTFPMIVSLLNIRSLKKLLGYRMNLTEIIFKPLLAGAVCGITAFGAYLGMAHIFSAERIAVKAVIMAVAIVLGALAYALMLVLLREFSKEELKSMPIIKKIYKK